MFGKNKSEKFPLKNYTYEIPSGDHVGAFGAKRKFDIHTGIDLYCEAGDEVICIEDGIILDIIKFTGPLAKSPWWHETDAILIIYFFIAFYPSLRKGVITLNKDIQEEVMQKKE